VNRSTPAYVVISNGCYLKLDGPFQYPRWVETLVYATPLTHAKAVQWVSIVGGRAVSLESLGQAFQSVDPFPYQDDDKSPETQREGTHKYRPRIID
jgi:hypothetical protein